MNNKVLASYETSNRRDAVNTGYTYTLYADGRVAATSFSRWQGTLTGTRYVTSPGYLDVTIPAGYVADHDTTLRMAVRSVDPTVWRQVRRGVVVR